MSDNCQLSFNFEFPERKPVPGPKVDPREIHHERKIASVPPVAQIANRQTGKQTRRPTFRGRKLDLYLTAKSRNLIEELGLPKLAEQVKVIWNSRLQTTAGMADAHKQQVTLNPKLLDFDPKELDTTLRHELAHLVAYSRAGGRRIQAHGSEWRVACRELGIPNEKRCHDLPLESRRQRPKFAYQCVHCETVYPRVRKFRWQAACYSCCRQHNRGRYSSRYLLKEVSLHLLLRQDAEQTTSQARARPS